MMSNDISSVQNQIQNAIQIHHGGGGGGHGKKINKMQFVAIEAEREGKVKPKKPFKSEITTKIAVNPDADSKQQQQNNKSSQEQNKDEETEEKAFGLDTLELIGQNNMMTIYTLAQIKEFNQY
jgi:hypothetical protein